MDRDSSSHRGWVEKESHKNILWIEVWCMSSSAKLLFVPSQVTLLIMRLDSVISKMCLYSIILQFFNQKLFIDEE